ncbi:MAG: carbohydrate ABC transporter permease [Lachnospiraceae bacterium]|nr:carbohydrate ABC transporter permease [Lachnospiraceae bacterium]
MKETKLKRKNKIAETNTLTSVGPLGQIIMHLVIGGFALLCIIPFIFVVIISFTSETSIMANGYSFFPKETSLEAYRSVIILGRQLWISLGNSIFVTIVGTFTSVLICVLYSYAIYRPDFTFRRFFTFVSFFTMLFGGGLVPTVVVCKNLLGMSNNYWALIVPMLVNPFNIIVMRSFFQASVPFELIEAARVDGAGEFRTLFGIVTPIAKPGIATIALLNMLAYWNEWFIPQLYITDDRLVPLQYLLVRLQTTARLMAANSGRAGAEIRNMPTENLRMALCVIIVIPIAFAYPFFQRYIVSGLTIGSVKG